MSEPIRIDGSQGEGGGQILRTALSLACLSGQGLQITQIRSHRQKPGLMPQHLTAVKALKEVTQAEVKGDSLGSQELTFLPGPIKAGSWRFDVGTAGSVSLIFQALFPVLSLGPGESTLTITGGTHVPFSPPVTYLKEVFLPVLEPLGFQGEIVLRRWGWYPKGGGEIYVKINPRRPAPWPCFTLEDPGRLRKVRGLSVVANLPKEIAFRQKQAALNLLSSRNITADIEIVECQSQNPGTFLFIVEEFDHIKSGFSSLGEIKKPAERVGQEAAIQALSFLDSGKAVDPCLSDQLLIYLALTPGEHRFGTSCLTKHLLTNLQVIKQILGTSFKIVGDGGQPGELFLRVAQATPKQIRQIPR